MLNLLVAVVLSVCEDEIISSITGLVTAADLEFFADRWAAYPRTGILSNDPSRLFASQLSVFLYHLGPRLGYDPALDSASYRMRFVSSLDVPVDSEGCISYTYLLLALVKRVLRSAEVAASSSQETPSRHPRDISWSDMNAIRASKAHMGLAATESFTESPEDTNVTSLAHVHAVVVLQRGMRRWRLRRQARTEAAAKASSAETTESERPAPGPTFRINRRAQLCPLPGTRSPDLESSQDGEELCAEPLRT